MVLKAIILFKSFCKKPDDAPINVDNAPVNIININTVELYSNINDDRINK